MLLATGGAGQLFAATTNPLQSTGDGLAMALRAGVACADIEFMQFHPTALLSPRMPRPLLSEALRGHGALIRDLDGKRFVDELQPRDVVARAITRKMLEEDADHMLLDATGLERFDERFPTIAADLRSAGLDPATDYLPIAPAAHYHCGGIVTDLNGASIAARAVGRGRGGLHRRPRRQPAGQQLAAGGHGVRAQGDRGHRPRRRSGHRPPAPCGPCSSGASGSGVIGGRALALAAAGTGRGPGARARPASCGTGSSGR